MNLDSDLRALRVSVAQMYVNHNVPEREFLWRNQDGDHVKLGGLNKICPIGNTSESAFCIRGAAATWARQRPAGFRKRPEVAMPARRRRTQQALPSHGAEWS
ncbi:MAG: hypothetical protein QF473_11525 [Planctomycetota bacterium]|nr:hypothetical protein [Planctomycetota bacterium]